MQKVKEGELPPPDQDKKYSYLWNCRGAAGALLSSVRALLVLFRPEPMLTMPGRACAGELDQAARIIIATDNDGPGQVCKCPGSRIRLGRCAFAANLRLRAPRRSLPHFFGRPPHGRPLIPHRCKIQTQ